MSADLEQFYEVFFEESSELLAEMESCLLGLDVNSPDMEDMNAIFRAAHSIKGGAGNLTADKLSGIAAELEKTVKSGNLTGSGEILERLEYVNLIKYLN